MSKPNRYLTAVEALFKSRPNQEISCYELAEVGGFSGWRTRVSECRCLRDMEIPEPRKDTLPSGASVTYYRYVPAEPSQSVLSFGSKDEAA